MRPCEIFLQNRGELLGNHGYESDDGKVNRTDNGITFYHYTNRNNLEQIMRGEESGLYARVQVLHSDKAPEFEDCYLVEALLEPLPRWTTCSPYFGDVGLYLLESYVGDFLLKVEVPADYPGLYVSDYAHMLEWKHVLLRGGPVLNLSYDVTNGRETTQADVYSYISASEYVGGHVAPVLKIIRKGKGIAIPNKYITISEEQPFKDTSGKLPYRYLTKIHGIPEEILRQMDAIDKIVYGIAIYRIKKKIFPESIDELTKAPEDLRKRLCFPGREYDMPVEFLYSGIFDISKDNSACFVHFSSRKIMFDEIKKYFIRPNFIVDENYLVYRISISSFAQAPLQL